MSILVINKFNYKKGIHLDQWIYSEYYYCIGNKMQNNKLITFDFWRKKLAIKRKYQAKMINYSCMKDISIKNLKKKISQLY